MGIYKQLANSTKDGISAFKATNTDGCVYAKMLNKLQWLMLNGRRILNVKGEYLECLHVYKGIILCEINPRLVPRRSHIQIISTKSQKHA